MDLYGIGNPASTSYEGEESQIALDFSVCYCLIPRKLKFLNCIFRLCVYMELYDIVDPASSSYEGESNFFILSICFDIQLVSYSLRSQFFISAKLKLPNCLCMSVYIWAYITLPKQYTRLSNKKRKPNLLLFWFSIVWSQVN